MAEHEVQIIVPPVLPQHAHSFIKNTPNSKPNYLEQRNHALLQEDPNEL